jgi:thioredoxin 1
LLCEAPVGAPLRLIDAYSHASHSEAATAFPLFFSHPKSGITRYHSSMENSATSPTVNLDDSNFEKEVTQSDQTVLVDFWAPWCGPCKMIAPLLDEIATEKAGSVKVAKVNVDENQSLSVKYNVRAIPALLFFKNGQLRDQIVGMTTRKDLLGRLDALA